MYDKYDSDKYERSLRFINNCGANECHEKYWRKVEVNGGRVSRPIDDRGNGRVACENMIRSLTRQRLKHISNWRHVFWRADRRSQRQPHSPPRGHHSKYSCQSWTEVSSFELLRIVYIEIDFRNLKFLEFVTVGQKLKCKKTWFCVGRSLQKAAYVQLHVERDLSIDQQASVLASNGWHP